MKILRSISGFALPSAIFLLVILSALGAFILNVSSSQQLGMALDIRGERAWQAANAGMEWVRYRLAANPSAPVCPANTSIGFAANGTLADFRATVECRQVSATDVQGCRPVSSRCESPRAVRPPPPSRVARGRRSLRVMLNGSCRGWFRFFDSIFCLGAAGKESGDQFLA